MPNFSKKRKPVIRLHQLNPFLRAEQKRMAAYSRDASFNAVFNSVEETK